MRSHFRFVDIFFLETIFKETNINRGKKTVDIEFSKIHFSFFASQKKKNIIRRLHRKKTLVVLPFPSLANESIDQYTVAALMLHNSPKRMAKIKIISPAWLVLENKQPQHISIVWL